MTGYSCGWPRDKRSQARHPGARRCAADVEAPDVALFCQSAYEGQQVLDLSVAKLAAPGRHHRRTAHGFAALGDYVDDFLIGPLLHHHGPGPVYGTGIGM